MDYHWGIWAKYDLVHFRRSYLEVDLDDMLSDKSHSRRNWSRRPITIAITEREIPITLSGWFANIDFPFGNSECNPEPKHYDVV